MKSSRYLTDKQHVPARSPDSRAFIIGNVIYYGAGIILAVNSEKNMPSARMLYVI